MPIFCSNVNQAYQEKLVPITHHNDASIVPDNLVIALKRVAEGPENGPFWELEAETPNVGRRYLQRVEKLQVVGGKKIRSRSKCH